MYFNTSLNGRGNQYPDPQSKFLASENSYILLTVERGGKLTVEIKSLENTVLDQRGFDRVATAAPGAVSEGQQ